MTRSVHSQSVATIVLALFATAALVLLAVPGRSTAQARSAPCAAPRAGQPHRGANVCSRSDRASGSSHKAGAHAQPTTKGRRSRHSAARHRTAKRRTARGPAKKKRTRSSAPARLTPAICEDGSQPVSTGAGRFSCEDGSEPICEDGSPVTVRDGSQPECAVSATGVATEARCEDASSPVSAGDGQFSCDDESEPVCEDGSEPTPSSDGSRLLCDAGAPGKGEG